jgi:dephospho-CoA kinase
VLDAGGALDRRRLRARVFADPAARQRLEAILHPRIEAATLGACDGAGGEYQLVVVPLLFESGFDRHVDRTLVVDCPEAIQRERLQRRDGATPAEIEGMLAAQLDRQTRLRRADDVVANDGTPEEARTRVRQLHERYLALAGQRRPSRH